MSWRQGFFRVWVLLSLIWVVIVVLFSYDSVVNPWIRDRAYAPRLGADAPAKRKQVTDPAIIAKLNELKAAEAADPSLVERAQRELRRRKLKAELERRKAEFVPLGDDGYDPIEEFSAQYRNFEQGVEAGDLQKVEIKGVPGIFLFMRATTPPERVNKHVEEVKPMAAALRSQLVSEKRTDALWGTLGAAFIPPLVVLILGLAIAWVLAGFRRPPPRRGGETLLR